MSRTERYATIERLLRSRRAIGFAELQARLEVSRATLFRDIAHLRDRLDPAASGNFVFLYAPLLAPWR